MAILGDVSWGKIIMGAALVTAAVAACLFMGDSLGPSIGGATETVGGIVKTLGGYAGTAIKGAGDAIIDIGGWIVEQAHNLAVFGQSGDPVSAMGITTTTNKLAAMGTAAVAGAVGVVAATNCVDRLNRSAEAVGIETGRSR